MPYRLAITAALLFILVMLIILSSPAKAQNLLTNPGFENGSSGWSTDCTIEINPETVYGGVNSGNHVTEIDVERCLKQQVSINRGAMYDFSFIASRRQGSTLATVGINVTITGTESGTKYVNSSQTYTNTSWAYTTQSFVFTIPTEAIDNSVMIRFTNYVTTGTYGTLIDDINFSVDPQSATLPVKLTSFSGSLRNSIAMLDWKTTTGQQEKAFVVEKRVAGGNFDSVSIVKGLANTFSYSDPKPIVQPSQYRLRMVTDAGTIYSKIISLSAAVQLSQVQVYPNPATSYVGVRINADREQKTTVKVFDRAGQVWLAKNYTLISGENNYTIDISSLKGGSFFLQVSGTGIDQVKQFCKN